MKNLRSEPRSPCGSKRLRGHKQHLSEGYRDPGSEAGLEANRVRNREEGVILRLSDRQTGEADRFVKIEDLVTQHIHTDLDGYSGIG